MKKSDCRQSSARDPFDRKRSPAAPETTSRHVIDEHSEEKSPGDIRTCPEKIRSIQAAIR
jgi:hypothetical protein